MTIKPGSYGMMLSAWKLFRIPAYLTQPCACPTHGIASFGKNLLLGILLFTFVGASGHAALAAPLPIGFVERPGYASIVDGKADGLLIRIAGDILTRAGIEYQFKGVPQKRLVDNVRANKEPICALGLFKTPERELFAVYSKPIYQNKPTGVLIVRARADAFTAFKSVKELTASTTLTLGYIDGFSYGNDLDKMIAIANGNKDARVNSPVNMVAMLNGRRFDYMFAYQEEYEALANAAGVDPAKLQLLSFPDISEGNKRYFMCSRSVPKDILNRIDLAIQPN
jgi:polar amino acid transport system substrate-binding protein